MAFLVIFLVSTNLILQVIKLNKVLNEIAQQTLDYVTDFMRRAGAGGSIEAEPVIGSGPGFSFVVPYEPGRYTGRCNERREEKAEDFVNFFAAASIWSRNFKPRPNHNGHIARKKSDVI